MGSNAEEIQAQKEEHQAFQETAKVIYATIAIIAFCDLNSNDKTLGDFTRVIFIIYIYCNQFFMSFFTGHIRLWVSVTERRVGPAAIV